MRSQRRHVACLGNSVRRAVGITCLMVLSAAYTGCARPSSVSEVSSTDTLAVQRAALTSLFIEREHGKVLVLLRAPEDSAPVLSGLPADSGRRGGLAQSLAVPDAAVLALAIPVHVVTLADVEAVFRANPDGWAAWYSRYPQSSGLIEMTAPRFGRLRDGTRTSTMTIARSCGELCETVWRVTLQERADGSWGVESRAENRE